MPGEYTWTQQLKRERRRESPFPTAENASVEILQNGMDSLR